MLRRSARTSAASEAAGGAEAEPEAMPAAGAAGQGERGEDCDERCAKRRREENAAVVPTMVSNAAPTVSDRQRR